MAERKRYVHLFETVSDFNAAYKGEDYHEPWVSYVKENERVDYNKVEERDYSKEYLTIEALESGNITPNIKVEYSVNGGEWIENSGAEAITLSQGDKVKFRGTEGGSNLFGNNTLMFKVYGNIESLEYKDDFVGKTSVKSGFDTCFKTCAGLTDASNLVLPATTLASSCYDSMFQGCTSLTQAPELPATTLAIYCYSSMFQGCTSLTKAPELPIGILVEGCYSGMFSGCTNLNYIKCLATNIPAEECTYKWVEQVAANGTFVKASSMSSWTRDADGIPENWTVQDAY